MSKRKRIEEMSKTERAAHEVHQYQVEYLLNNHNHLSCGKNGCKGLLKSDGKGGTPGRAGISLLQVKCKICEAKHRLQNTINEEREKASFLAGLNELLEKAEPATTKQPTLDAFFVKTAREPQAMETMEADGYWDKQPVVENSQEKESGKGPSDTVDHEVENMKLKAIIQEQADEIGKQAKEIEKLKKELETFRKEVRSIVLEEMQKHIPATIENKTEKAQPGALMRNANQKQGNAFKAKTLTWAT